MNTTRRTRWLGRVVGRWGPVFGLPAALLLGNAGCFSGLPQPAFLRVEPAKDPEKDSFILRPDGLVEEKAAPSVANAKDSDMAAGREYFRVGDYPKAERIFEHITQIEKTSPAIAQESMYYYAETLRMQQKYCEAAECYISLLSKFPNSSYREQCVQQMFTIANYWLDETRQEMKEAREQREGKRWVVWPHFISFEKTKPFLDREGRTIQLLEQVRMHDINGPLADQALFWCGAVKMYNEDYREADYYLSQIHARHPESPLAPQALELAIYCKHMSTGGGDYDGRKTAEARKLIQAALHSYPKIANDPEKRAFLEKQVLSINEQQAEKDYKMAEFYRRTGHPASAYFYYEMVRRRYPQTKHARLAEVKWNELRSTLEKDHAKTPPDKPVPGAAPTKPTTMQPGPGIPATNNRWSGGPTPPPTSPQTTTLPAPTLPAPTQPAATALPPGMPATLPAPTPTPTP